MLKNVASQKVGVQMVSATDGSAFTGSVTASVTGDAGTQATGSVGSGACTHEGNGYHTYAPAQAETNYDLIAFTFTGTGAVPATVQIYPLPTTGILSPATLGRTLVVDSAGLADANAVKIGPTGSGTAQTARDIGASVLLSSGTGTGQLDFTSGVVKSSLVQILGTALTETAGQIAAAFKKFFDKATPTGTINSIPDAVAGASGGLLISGSNSGTTTLGALTVSGATTLTGAVSLGSTLGITGAITATNASNNLTLGTFTVTTNAIAWNAAWDAEVQSEAQDAITASSLPTAAQVRAEIDSNSTQLAAIVADTNELQTDWANGGRLDLLLDTTISQTTAAAIRTDVGLASANLDTQLDALPTNAELATALGTADDAVLSAIAALSIPTTAQIATAVFTTAMTESYRATNAAPTLAQAQFELIAHMGEKSISGTTYTLKKIDGSTTAKTYTLNDGTNPTAITETT